MGNQYSDKQLVAYCGINCKACKARSGQRKQLAKYFQESLQELPLELFSKIIPQFKNIKQVLELLEFLQRGQQTCCTSTEMICGKGDCEVRFCVKNKGFRTCAECNDFSTCSKLDFLKPGHKTLLSDLDFIKANGLDAYVKDVVAKFQLEPIIIN